MLALPNGDYSKCQLQQNEEVRSAPTACRVLKLLRQKARVLHYPPTALCLIQRHHPAPASRGLPVGPAPATRMAGGAPPSTRSSRRRLLQLTPQAPRQPPLPLALSAMSARVAAPRAWQLQRPPGPRPPLRPCVPRHAGCCAPCLAGVMLAAACMAPTRCMLPRAPTPHAPPPARPAPPPPSTHARMAGSPPQPHALLLLLLPWRAASLLLGRVQRGQPR